MKMGDDTHGNERQGLQTRLLDAVKQCQVRFGGKTELATDTDSRVSCLCSAWESVLQHGLKGETKAIAALKQVSEMTRLNKVAGLFAEKPGERDYAFWCYVKEMLTRHEVDRFMLLKNISTDSGRGRAWLRATLNEHTLERYMHMLTENESLIGQYYESWAFLCDQEKSSMLPMMARGLDSILFAITVDNEDLNAVRTSTGAVNVGGGSGSLVAGLQELRPVIAGESPPDKERKKERKKKKKVAHIVSFDEDETGSGKFSRMSSSPGKSPSFSCVTPLQQASQHNIESYSDPSTKIDAKDTNIPLFGANPNQISNIGDFQTIDQTESAVAKTHRLKQPDEFLDDRHREKRMSSQSGIEIPQLMQRQTSRGSVSKRSQGSISSTDFELSVEISGMTPITPGGEPAFDDDIALNCSGDFNSLSEFNGNELESATFALQQAQISFSESHRTQGDGGNVDDNIHTDRMSTDELKKAVVSMMLRKDEVEDQNKSLQQLLEQEVDCSSTLRAEIEDMKHQTNIKLEKEQAKLITLQKENELLKHQLRKYVNAVQMLRTDGASVDATLGIHMEEPQPSIPPEKSSTDYSQEAEEYEKKLIQVAEMHGELMEFNEMLHRHLHLRDSMLKRLQGELVDLRGPLPNDISFADDIVAIGANSLSLQQSSLINVWIPSAFLRGKTSDQHHVYQVYVRIRDEEWNVYKRYKQFDELHSSMKKKYPLTGKYNFPQKKAFGKKDSKVVESRRPVLQSYLRSLINHMLEKESRLSGNVCKQTLLDILPFFSNKVTENDKSRRKGEATRTSMSSSPLAETTSPEQYAGL